MSDENKSNGCYDCTHFNVCKYQSIIHNMKFPFKSDGHIGRFLAETSKAFKDACAHYDGGVK